MSSGVGKVLRIKEEKVEETKAQCASMEREFEIVGVITPRPTSSIIQQLEEKGTPNLPAYSDEGQTKNVS